MSVSVSDEWRKPSEPSGTDFDNSLIYASSEIWTNIRNILPVLRLLDRGLVYMVYRVSADYLLFRQDFSFN